MRILEERRMDKNYPTIPEGEITIDVAINMATTSGLWLMVNRVLENTRNKKVRAEDLLHTPEGKQLKDQLKAGLTALMGNLGGGENK